MSHSPRIALKIESIPGTILPFVIAALKVRLDDKRPGNPVPEEQRPGGGSAETPTRRTTVVSPVHRQEQEPGPPARITPDPTGTPKPVPDKDHRGGAWFSSILFIIIFVIALIFVILRRGRSPEQPRHPDESYKPPNYPLRIAIKFKSGGGKGPQQLDGCQASFEGAVKPLAPLRLMPLIGSLNSKLFSELVDLARKNDPDYKPVDFSSW